MAYFIYREGRGSEQVISYQNLNCNRIIYLCNESKKVCSVCSFDYLLHIKKKIRRISMKKICKKLLLLMSLCFFSFMIVTTSAKAESLLDRAIDISIFDIVYRENNYNDNIYKINIPVDGTLSVEVNCGCGLYIYDSNLVELRKEEYGGGSGGGTLLIHVKKGVYYIRLSTSSYGPYKLITTFKPDVHIESITLSPKSLTLNKGQSAKFNPTFSPSNTTSSKIVKWSSSNSNIAYVDSKGLVTAVNNGTATITAECDGVKTTGNVVVTQPLQKIDLNRSSMILSKNNSVILNVKYYPSSQSYGKIVNWKSSNRKVATVNSNGKVIGKKSGYTKITAEVNGKTSSCTVYIRPDKTTLTKAKYYRNKQIKLSWKKTSNITGYKIYRSTSKTGTFKKIASISSPSTTSYVDRKISKKKTYYYKVTTYNKINKKSISGSTSNIKSIKTK